METIRISCDVATTANLADLYEFQGDLKSLSTANYDRLKASILRHGVTMPFHAWENEGKLWLLDGHQRKRVLTKMGEEGFIVPVVPVVRVSAPTLPEAKHILLTMVSQYGTVEKQGLYQYLIESEISPDALKADFEIPLVSLDADSFKTEFFDDNKAPPGEDPGPGGIPTEATTKRGDVWVLGGHRLMCGDSTMVDDLMKLMGADLADFTFTDPPYNVDYKGGNSGHSKLREKIANDSMSPEEFYQFLLMAYSNMRSFMKPGSSIYVSHADTERVAFTDAFVKAGFHFSSVIIWAKNNATFGRQDYFWKHEPLLYGWHNGGAHAWYGPNNEETIWMIDRPSKSDEHPTMKPIELIERAMRNSSKTGDIVLDVFGGSGSTLIASEKNQRHARLMEMEPKYCDVIVNRWEKMTGQKAELAQ